MTHYVPRALIRDLRRATALAAGLVLAVAMLLCCAAPAAATAGLTPAQVHSQQWWIGRLNLQKAWTITKGKGVTVAVIDSGVNADFGDLRGAIVPGFAVTGGGNGETDTDPAVHGTRIADEIAGRGTGFGLLGIAPKAKILPIASSTSNGSPEHSTVTALNRLVAMAHPPQVVNMSYGFAGSCPTDLREVVAKAVLAGIILVASAGNSGDAGSPPEFPANCPGVVAVGAVDHNGTTWSGSTRGPYVALGGPGVHMVGYDAEVSSGYGYANGTSDASAIVSGIFALMRAKHPTMPARTIVARVLYTAHQFIGAKHTRNEQMGYGVALPYNALTEKVPPNAPNPVYDAVPAATGSSTPPSTQDRSGPTTPGASTPATGTPGSLGGGGSSSSNTGVIAAVIVVVILIIAVVLFFVLRARRPARR